MRQVNEEMFLVGDAPVLLGNDTIHKVIGLCNEGCNLVNEKNVKKLVEANLKTKSDRRNMRLVLIKDTSI